MSAQGRNHDDPTRVLDDFIQRSAPHTGMPSGAPDLSDLMGKLHPDLHLSRSAGGVLKDGTRWDADDVIDVPVVDLPRNAPSPRGLPKLSLPLVDLDAEDAQAAALPTIDLPAVGLPCPPDSADVAQATGAARDFAAAQWLAEARAAEEPAPQPDAHLLPSLLRRDPRLLTQWQSGAWLTAVRWISDATTEFIHTPQGPVIETYPAQYLVAWWAPGTADQPALERWPSRAGLCAASAEHLPQALLAEVPEALPLWRLPDGHGLPDWALVAEIVLIHEPGLRPLQSQALRDLIERERETSFARMNDRYARPADARAVQQRG